MTIYQVFRSLCDYSCQEFYKQHEIASTVMPNVHRPTWLDKTVELSRVGQCELGIS